MAKKELTIKEKASKCHKYSILCRVGEYAVLPVPYVVMGIVYHETWFPDASTGFKVSVGFGLALMMMFFATYLVTKKKENNEITDGYITLLLGWVMCAAILTCISNIIAQLAQIMWFGALGVAAGFGIDMERKHLDKEYKRWLDKLESAQSKIDEEQALQELKEEQKKVKVRIKVKKDEEEKG